MKSSSPTPELGKNKPTAATAAPAVKGIYVSAHVAGSTRLSRLIQLVDNSKLNSMVIDVKDDWGHITFDTGQPTLQQWHTTQPIIRHMTSVVAQLREHHIYPIARIVVFKDSVLAKKQPQLSFLQDGTLWTNSRGESYVNPYLKQVWDYNVEIAKAAAAAGFLEVQFDYVRFPEGFEKRTQLLQYEHDLRSRTEVIGEFVRYAKKQLQPLGIRLSVDVFGYAASVPAAEGIGQDFVKISEQVDVISPMIYPSHYSAGWFGAPVPDVAPYRTISGAVRDTRHRLNTLGAASPVIRPWIQGFTAHWVEGHIDYGKAQLEQQIQALKDNGIDEFLIWNSSSRYVPLVDD